MIDPHQDFIIPLMRSMRGEIMAGFGKDTATFKDNRTAVTDVDKSIEQQLATALREKYPHIGVTGEELGKQGNQDTYWLIDPIDGTENYIRGLPGITSIVGLVEDGEVVQAYVYDPLTDVMYYAIKGKGAFANDKKISISTRDKGRAFIAFSSSDESRDCEAAIDAAGVLYTTKYLGRGTKAVYLATGKIEGIIALGAKGGVWDIAPTNLLAVEAGAVLTDFDGQGLFSRKYCLLSPTIHDELVEIIRKFADA